MSMIASPHQQKPAPPLPQWLRDEWRHWAAMPPPRLGLLALPSLVLLVVSPLLPIAAYALWLWAAHSWAWRDRWASVTFWAKQGGWWIAALAACVALDAAHGWIVPQFLAAAQAFWHAHLPGDLSLSPLDTEALMARTLLLLPLAPALALVYEYVDPRTPMHPQRVLTPADLAEPTTPAPAPPPAAQTTPPATPTHKQEEPVREAAPPKERKRKSTRKDPQQMTIESFLSPAPAQATPVPSPREKKTEPPAPTHPSEVPDIDWDDVAE